MQAGSGYAVATFACGPDADRWGVRNWVGPRPMLVFGHSAVEISAAGGRPVVGTANEALWYDADTEYVPHALTERGDDVTYLTFDESLADEVWAGRKPQTALTQMTCSAAAYLLGQRLRSLAGAEVDRLVLDETEFALIGMLVGSIRAYRPEDGARNVVARVRGLIAADPARDRSLGELAAEVHYTPWFLTRTFTEVTGMRMSVYRQGLRLREAHRLVRTRPDRDLSSIAVACGFSSHSHLTRLFREAFGVPPSAVRGVSAG